MIGKISETPAGGAALPAREDPVRIKEAAMQFESLLLAQILKSMREAGSEGWLGGGEDQASLPALELAEEQFAQALSARGGLGLSDLVVSGLTRTR